MGTNIPEKVPNHLLELKKICQEYFFSRKIDEESFANMTLRMLQGTADTKEVAGFIMKLKVDLKSIYEQYNDMRDQVNRYLWSAVCDTLPWPSAFKEANISEHTKLLALLAKLESADKGLLKFNGLIQGPIKIRNTWYGKRRRYECRSNPKSNG